MVKLTSQGRRQVRVDRVVIVVRVMEPSIEMVARVWTGTRDRSEGWRQPKGVGGHTPAPAVQLGIGHRTRHSSVPLVTAVAVDGSLQLGVVAQIQLVTLVRVEVFHVSGRGCGSWVKEIDACQLRILNWGLSWKLKKKDNSYFCSIE